MKVLKTLVQIQETGALAACDTIEHEGKLWLVTSWIAGPAPGTERPERIICVSGLPLIRPGPRYRGIDWVLGSPMPTAVLQGLEKPQSLAVVDLPEIIRSVGPNLH